MRCGQRGKWKRWIVCGADGKFCKPGTKKFLQPQTQSHIKTHQVLQFPEHSENDSWTFGQVYNLRTKLLCFSELFLGRATRTYLEVLESHYICNCWKSIPHFQNFQLFYFARECTNQSGPTQSKPKASAPRAHCPHHHSQHRHWSWWWRPGWRLSHRGQGLVFEKLFEHESWMSWRILVLLPSTRKTVERMQTDVRCKTTWFGATPAWADWHQNEILVALQKWQVHWCRPEKLSVSCSSYPQTDPLSPKPQLLSWCSSPHQQDRLPPPERNKHTNKQTKASCRFLQCLRYTHTRIYQNG